MRVSTLDVTGKGLFTVVTGLAGTAWKDAVDRLDLPFLRIVVTGSSEAQDLYCEWQRIREIDEAGVLLVRPDGVVSWRDKDGTSDNGEAFDRLRRGNPDGPRPQRSLGDSARETTSAIEAQRHAAFRLTHKPTRFSHE